MDLWFMYPELVATYLVGAILRTHERANTHQLNVSSSFGLGAPCFFRTPPAGNEILGRMRRPRDVSCLVCATCTSKVAATSNNYARHARRASGTGPGSGTMAFFSLPRAIPNSTALDNCTYHVEVVVSPNWRRSKLPLPYRHTDGWEWQVDGEMEVSRPSMIRHCWLGSPRPLETCLGWCSTVTREFLILE
jgi:hypothetical protein